MKEYDFECVVNCYSGDPYIFSASALEEFQKGTVDLPDDYNIYLITKISRAWFVPDSLFVNKSRQILIGKYTIMKEYV